MVGATRRVAELEPDRPLHLVGASMGGNFALRLLWRHAQDLFPNLGQTVAICPGLDPNQVALSLDRSWWLYLLYFRRKWRHNFRNKQAAYPDLYGDITEVMTPTTTMAMTEAFARRYTNYPNAAAYFNSYTVTPDMLADTSSPATILAAADDPIVPANMFYTFEGINPHLRFHIQPYGGHCGFVDVLPRRSWMSQATLAILRQWERVG